MIRIEDVSYKYDSETNCIKNVNLHINKGEFVVLCGRSGCGKSTISRLINGLIPHFFDGKLSGDIFIDGKNTKELRLPQISSQVGSVFQNPKSQFFNTDTTSELAFGCENQGLERDETIQRIEQAVEHFKLEDLLNRNIFELSGGEKQRIACGSVYATKPQIFVLDEPSSNLDADSVKRLKEILTMLKKEEKTVVISEHRLYFLTELADRFIYIDNGEIVKEYSAKEFSDLLLNELNKLGLRTTKPQELVGCHYDNTDDKAVIEIENLTYSYSSKVALSADKINFTINSVVAVVGKNGAGKSTFLNCLCGILKAKGTVRINGEECNRKTRVKKSFMVMQDVNHQLFCDSVDAEARLNLSDEDAKIVPALLSRLNLSDKADTHPVSLSGGEKQRVAICCAIAAGKEILLYDEPTSGLDFLGMTEFASLVSEYRKNVLISFIVTHDIELILSCVDHVLHIEDGSIKDYYRLDNIGVGKIKQLAISN